MSERRPRVAVIGGGISGLAAAWFLRASLGDSIEIVVLEKKGQLGGHLRVSEVAGVPVDAGAESLLARRPEAVELARAVGLGDDVVHPARVGAGVWSRGSVSALPAATVMGVPAPDAALGALLTDAERARLRAEPEGAGLPIDADVAIGRLVGDRMGRAVVDRLVEPLLGGVYAGHADELSLDATVPALGAAARKHPSLGAAVAAVRAGAPLTPNAPVFAGIDGGVGRLPAAVAAASRAELRLGVTVRGLRRTSSGWRLVTGPVPAPETLEADAVVVAVPATPAARLLRDDVPVAAAELAGIETASMAIVTLALPATAFPEPPASSGFLVPPVDGRVVKAVTFSSVKWPWLRSWAGADVVLARASIGRHRQVAELQRDDDELIATTLTELGEALGVRGPALDTRVTRWGGALPQYAVGHLNRVARIRAGVEDSPGLAVCGAVYDGVGIAACVASARAAAERVAAHLSAARVRIGP